ncbi:hypothetical protein GCM10009539_20290 [Cryptosporangium japonicum]|uniref:Uncharacterized protein n=1 Tax=Cryptosporangium japonicum TaxID=80872 RepID=A0ABN0U0S3_9ACTN
MAEQTQGGRTDAWVEPEDVSPAAAAFAAISRPRRATVASTLPVLCSMVRLKSATAAAPGRAGHR